MGAPTAGAEEAPPQRAILASLRRARGAHRRRLLLVLVGLACCVTIYFSWGLVAVASPLRVALDIQASLSNISAILGVNETVNLAGVPPVTACRYCYTCYIERERKTQYVTPQQQARRRRRALEQHPQRQASHLAWVLYYHLQQQQQADGSEGAAMLLQEQLGQFFAHDAELAGTSWEELWYLHARAADLPPTGSTAALQPGGVIAVAGAASSAVVAGRIPVPAVLQQHAAPGQGRRRPLEQDGAAQAEAQPKAAAGEAGGGGMHASAAGSTASSNSSSSSHAATHQASPAVGAAANQTSPTATANKYVSAGAVFAAAARPSEPEEPATFPVKEEELEARATQQPAKPPEQPEQKPSEQEQKPVQHEQKPQQLVQQQPPQQPPHDPSQHYDPRASYPNCTRCTACTHMLEPLSTRRTLLGNSYDLGGQGASRAWIFKASSEYGEHGVAAAKVWCIPIGKSGELAASCELGSMDKYVSKLKALDLLIDDCGVRRLFSRVWVERIRGIMPQFGYVVDSDGMFMDIASGVPVHHETFMTPQHSLMKVWHLWKTVPSELIVQAAVFDLLTAQCDRHAENAFVDEAGRLTLIDNDQMLGESWRPCGVDSFFLPTTQKFEINVHGFFWIMRERYKNARPKGYPNPQLLFDYRCHTPGRKLGMDGYPAGLAKCMRQLSDMSLQEVQQRYSFHEKQALILQQRAKDMLEKGFEWTLEHGEPRNPPMISYAWQPPCCNMTYAGLWSGAKDDWRCMDKWEPEVAGEGPQPWLQPPRDEAEAKHQIAELRQRKGG